MGRSAAEPLLIEVRPAGEAAVVRLVGSADAAEAEALKARLEQLAEALPGAGPLVLDLADLEFICSAGLGALLSAYARLGRVAGAVRLVGPGPLILRVLETTCLTRILPVYASVEEALRA